VKFVKVLTIDSAETESYIWLNFDKIVAITPHPDVPDNCLAWVDVSAPVVYRCAHPMDELLGLL